MSAQSETDERNDVLLREADELNAAIMRDIQDRRDRAKPTCQATTPTNTYEWPAGWTDDGFRGKVEWTDDGPRDA